MSRGDLGLRDGIQWARAGTARTASRIAGEGMKAMSRSAHADGGAGG
jgi:hypothetical protein